MPLGPVCARNVLGANERTRSHLQKPVSGALRHPPRAPPGVRYVGNAPWDKRRLITVSTALLLTGQVLASAAAGGGQPTRSRFTVDDGPRQALARQPPSPRPATVAGALSTIGQAARFPSADTGESFFPSLTAGMPASLAELASDEALEVAEQSLGGGSSLLWQAIAAWFADPCSNLDQYANGFWKIQHPPAMVPPNFFSLAGQALSAELRSRMGQASVNGADAEYVLATLRDGASAFSTDPWEQTRPFFDATNALTDRAGIEHCLVSAVANGNPLLLTVDRLLRYGVFAAGPLAGDGGSLAAHAPDATDTAIAREKASIRSLLVAAGVAAADASSAAEKVFAMEALLVNASPQLQAATLEQARNLLPGLPWVQLWQVIGKEPGSSMFLELGTLGALATLLRDHGVDDWKLLLLCQQARSTQSLALAARTPDTLLAYLASHRGGMLLLSSWYGARFDPHTAHVAATVFAGLKQIFVDDVAASALPASDRQLLIERISTARLTWDVAGTAVSWGRFSASGSFLRDIQSLAALATAEDLRVLGLAEDEAVQETPAHRLEVHTQGLEGHVHVSPSLLASLAGHGAAREVRWARLGAMLGHELAHVMSSARGLSEAGSARMAEENALIREWLTALSVDGIALDVSAVENEAACDLRGLNAARRAGRVEADGVGEAFDDRVFFTAAAALHAANPTARQLRDQVARDEHPPAPFRAELGRFLDGFAAAFGCSAPTGGPFARILTPADPPGWTSTPS